jgi:hypothetical protein
MLSQKVFPSPVTEFDKPLRRINNVGKEYARENAVTIGFNVAALAGEERLDLSED